MKDLCERISSTKKLPTMVEEVGKRFLADNESGLIMQRQVGGVGVVLLTLRTSQTRTKTMCVYIPQGYSSVPCVALCSEHWAEGSTLLEFSCPRPDHDGKLNQNSQSVSL